MHWMKVIWVGRSDGDVVLTPHGRSHWTNSAKTGWKPLGKLKSCVQDPALSQAELLKVLPASVPIRLAGETDTDQTSCTDRANGRTRGRQSQGRGNEAIPTA